LLTRGFRSFWALTLFLSISPCSFAQQNPAADSTHPPATVSDEQAVQALAEQYVAAFAKADLDGMIMQWDAKSPALSVFRKQMQDSFAGLRSTTMSQIDIQKPVIEGDKASVQVTYLLDAVDPGTGKKVAAWGNRFHSLELVRTASGWKIHRDVNPAADLAALLIAAKDDQERSDLLNRDRKSITPALVQALGGQIVLLAQRGEWDRMLSVSQITEQLAETISDQWGMASTLRNVGYAQYALGKYAEALESFQKSLAIANQLDNKPTAAYVIGFMATIHSNQGNYPLALEEARKSEEIFESLGDKSKMARGLFVTGRVYLMQHQNTQALEYFSKSLAIGEELKDADLINRPLIEIGVLYVERGDYARALECYRKSLSISKAVNALPLEANALANIGEVYRRQNDFAEALNFYQQTLELARTTGDKDVVAEATMSSGDCRRRQGDFEQALADYRQALALYQEMGAKVGEAQVLASLGELYFARKNYDQAFSYFNQSLALSQELGNRRFIASSLLGLAEAHFAQKNFARTLDLASQALTAAQDMDDREVSWRSHWIAGRAYLALRRPDAARAAFDAAITAVESLRESVAGGAEQQQKFFADKLDPYRGMVELLVAQAQPWEALSYAERAKGRALLDVLGNGRVDVTKAMTAAEREHEEDLQAEIVSLNLQLADNTATWPDALRRADLKSRLEKARLEFADFQNSLYVAHPELRAQRGHVQSISFAEAAGLLPGDHSAVLEFMVAEEKTFLFVLRRNGGSQSGVPELKVYTIAVKAKALDRETEKFRRQLSSRDLEFGASAKALYNLLLRPAQAQLASTTALVIVPDGPLWNLPFQALQARPGRYLLEDHALSYAPSLTILREMVRLRNKRPEAAAATLLAMGDPTLATATSERARLTYRDEKLAPLPEAAREVEALQTLYGQRQSTVFVGPEATEDRFKSQAGQFRILHLATHGLLNDANPMYSHLLLSTRGPATKEDGLLEAWEIMNLDLRAELAVLSACETARGRITSGEGVIGLSWAFFVAGVPTTVVSQWKVESSSTAEIMLAFHRDRNAQEKHDPSLLRTARALQHAELQLLHHPRFSHPFYWAGFIVMGDPK
jgi:CHAT domain-containing protein